MTKIVYWSDYFCPYCYIGYRNMKKALEQSGLKDDFTLEMRAFQLNPEAPKVSNLTTQRRLEEKYSLSPEHAMERIEIVNRAGHQAGIDMRFGDVRGGNSFDALRLTKYAQSLGNAAVTDKLVESLYKAVFTDGLQISDHKVLTKLATEAGLDAAKVQKVLSSKEFASDVSFDERDAHKEGVRGVPYYIIGEHVLPGAYPVEEIVRILTKANKMDQMEKSVACDAAGCHVR